MPDMASADAPEGYMTNVYGHLVPAHRVRPAIKLQDQLVRDLLARADRLRDMVAAEKAAMLADVRAFLDILDEKYEVKRAGARGGVVLDAFDGNGRVTISVGDSITLGPAIAAARALIDECVGRWAAGANENLQAIVNDAFKVGEGGKLAVDRVLALRRIEIDDPTWQRAMEAIGDAVQTTRSREYLRLYRRARAEDKLEQVAVDWSKL
jgi:hypothetical protein